MSAPHLPQIRLYQNWLRDTRQLSFDSYDDLWRWSVTDLEAFWQSIWDYFDLQSPTPHSAVLSEANMPGAQWFPGAQFNYARQVFRHVDQAHAAGFPALLSHNEKSLAANVGAMRSAGSASSTRSVSRRRRAAWASAVVVAVSKGTRRTCLTPVPGCGMASRA